MSYISVDVEADGPCPGLYSMTEIGAVLVRKPLTTTFYGCLRPISDNYIEDALKVTGYSREQTMEFKDPKLVMQRFEMWLKTHASKPYIFVADNNGFDWQFVNYYFWRFLNRNPFGFSSRNLNDVFHGLKKDMRASFKKLRKTKHTHNPVDDAMGNAEAFLVMMEKYELKAKGVDY